MSVISLRPSKTYLTGPQLRVRYGRKSHVWLWRMIRNNPDFPRPYRINHQLYFDQSEVDAFDRERREPFVNKSEAEAEAGAP
jgi:predicted DNA-binding transcriptional regulator AlpA